MRIVFMGTPKFAAHILFEIAQQHEIVAVYTRADAVRGRGNTLVPTPVKEQALELNLPVFTPKSLKNAEEQAHLASLNPDVIVVAAYGMLLPKEVLDIPRFACINAHASLLPRWRGAAPIERAILAGDKQAGVCVMRMEEGLDTGDYCICRSTDIDDKNVEELTLELADLASEAMLSALSGFEQGKLFWVSQGEDGVTYANKIDKKELYLSVDDSAELAWRKVRCASEAHACKVVLADKSVSILDAAPVDASDLPIDTKACGSLVFSNKKLYLFMSDGVLEIRMLKPDGKKEMTAQAFAAGIQNARTQTLTWEQVRE